MKGKKSHSKIWKKYFFVPVLIFLASLIFVVAFLSIQKNDVVMPSLCKNFTKEYPEHPDINDCVCTEKDSFCIGDVAEIKNDVNICQQIKDSDVRNFCIARISLDRNLCSQLLDEGLRGACLESIELKLNWSRGL